jgi:hypothetical protein
MPLVSPSRHKATQYATLHNPLYTLTLYRCRRSAHTGKKPRNATQPTLHTHSVSMPSVSPYRQKATRCHTTHSTHSLHINDVVYPIHTQSHATPHNSLYTLTLYRCRRSPHKGRKQQVESVCVRICVRVYVCVCLCVRVFVCQGVPEISTNNLTLYRYCRSAHTGKKPRNATQPTLHTHSVSLLSVGPSRHKATRRHTTHSTHSLCIDAVGDPVQHKTARC